MCLDHDAVPDTRVGERTMSPRDYEAAIATFIRTKGFTRCPTACAASAPGNTLEGAPVERVTDEHDPDAAR
jgi:hypothetical protein